MSYSLFPSAGFKRRNQLAPPETLAKTVRVGPQVVLFSDMPPLLAIPFAILPEGVGLDGIFMELAKGGPMAVLLGLFIWQKFQADKEDRATNRQMMLAAMETNNTAIKELTQAVNDLRNEFHIIQREASK
jgi:hypothetical protein